MAPLWATYPDRRPSLRFILAFAVATLAATSPLDVQVLASVEVRPVAAGETAAYFVVAEALANAYKHAGARHVIIRVVREQGRLTVEVADADHYVPEEQPDAVARGRRRHRGVGRGVTSSPARLGGRSHPGPTAGQPIL